MINSTMNLQTVIQSIEQLSSEEQKLLLQQLQNLQIKSQQLTETTDADNPWIQLAGKYENDPMYDELLSYIDEYRHQLDTETQNNYSTK